MTSQTENSKVGNTRLAGAARKLIGFVPIIALSLSAMLVVVLAREVTKLRPQAAELKLRRAIPYVTQWVPTVRARTLSGDSVTIGETKRGQTQTLIFFTTVCPFCLETLPLWKRISATLRADPTGRHEVYWISLSSPDSTAAYVAKHAIEGTVVFPPPKMISVYRVKGVPMTLVINDRGQITHVHASVFQSNRAVDSVLVAARVQDTLQARAATPPRNRTQ